MRYKYKRNLVKKTVLKLLMIPILIILSLLAIKAGVAIGDFVHDADKATIQNIDTENFKSTINMSLPIINLIYNSGKISVSVSGEAKGIIKLIFGIDFDMPLSILNVQSPLLLSYYNNEYKSMLAMDKEPDLPIATPTPSVNVPESTFPGNSPSFTPIQPSGFAMATPSPEAVLNEPISSIVFEVDDENEDEGDIVKHNKIRVANHTSFKINIEQLLKESLNLKFSRKGPKVLIYQTHTTESYVINKKDIGKSGIPSYNKNPRYNVVRVGEELSRNLKKLGVEVLHNGTVHDTNFPASYGASLKTITQYKKSYPSVKIMFDVHRDGVEGKRKLREVTNINGKNAAKIMFVVGTNGNGLPHPEWRENLKFALKLQEVLMDRYPGLAKSILISKNRYNQHLTNNSLIIEIGGDGNLLEECLLSTKYLADAVNRVINQK